MMFYSKDCCEIDKSQKLTLRQTAQYTALHIILRSTCILLVVFCQFSSLSNENDNIDKIDCNGHSYLAPPPQ